MLIPLGVLGLGAILSGMIWYSSFFGKDYQVANFFGINSEYHQTNKKGSDDNPIKYNSDEIKENTPPTGAIFMGPKNHVLHDAHYAPVWVKISPFLAMLTGLLMALWFYVWDKKKPAQWASTLDPIYRLLLNKWYFDDIYEVVFVSRARALGRFFWKKGDGGLIDGTINGIALGIVPFVTRISTRLQSGYIFSYALSMVLGILALLSWMIFSVGVN
jgi:NADH-quinone oxidoreductase subunit L